MQVCGSLKLSLERVQGIVTSNGLHAIIVQCVFLLVEDVDGDDDADTAPASGWEVLKDPEGDVVIGSQIGVKVC